MSSTPYLPVTPASPVDLRILCADDDAVCQQILMTILARPGWTVECVGDGEEALDRFTGGPPAFDLLVTDHHMQRLGGLGLVQRLRALGFAGPVIVVSGSVTAEVDEAYRAAGVHLILKKPVGYAPLLAAVHFARTAAPSASGQPATG